MTPRQFQRRMKTIARNVESNADRLPSRVALTFVATVAHGTPIDTGKAQGNWQVGIGGPMTRQVHDPSRFGAAEAIRIATNKLQNYKGGKNIHVTNNLPYIGALDRGHSKQAPAGFIDLAYDAALRQIRESKLFTRGSKTAGDRLVLSYTEQEYTYDD